jgi:hypothetical protein
MVNLVGVFWGTDDQKCFLRVLMGLVVWGSEKLFLGGFDKNKNIFFLKKDSNYFNMIHQNKSLKKLFFMGA